ncbi:hypothetical protein [Thermotalea metallivorans]|uniref:Uncharacterized protein n=1 Tax=Thermotalea metallivorans TaxID=520762 RepID=A0A140KZE2_9FIRM|nr:hypothetical protein [Thermotalea metallivorans]KXG73667.1 hypothetical protein AN619_30000 [Thermotalea metallivorans]
MQLNILGSLGQLYMFILLALLFLGSGLAVWSFINYLSSRAKGKSGTKEKGKGAGQDQVVNYKILEKAKMGGFKMMNNGWFKLAVFSFLGILASVVVLGFVSTNNSMADNNIHLQHQQQGFHQNPMGGISGNMQMQGGMNAYMPTGNIQMQGSMGGNVEMNMPTNYHYLMMQQQLNQIQQQLHMMQQQINGNMGGNMQMQGSMSGNNGMGMMNMMPMGGMMGMNNMNNMNNMQQNSGGMGMM